MLLAGAALGLTACKSDEPVVSNQNADGSEGEFYTTLTLNFGSGTRSTTDSDDTTGKGSSNHGEEDAILSEYNIDEILVVLCTQNNETKEYEYVTHALANAVRKTNADPRTPTYVVRFETQALYDLAGDDEFVAGSYTKGDVLHVFTYCNPTNSMKAPYTSPADPEEITFNPDAVFSVDGTQEILWDDNKFVMTNAELASVQLPSKYALLYDYNKETTPFNLGSITVQRLATRFDIANNTDAYVEGLGYNTFPIYNSVNGDEENPVIDAYVTIDGVSFFNEAKNYYGFMHTSEDGTNKDWKFCGYDRIGNYVVSPYFETTTALRGNANFNYSMVDVNNNLIAPELWKYDLISSITNGREDNVQWDNEYKDKFENLNGRNYYFWKYSTPNTIPGIDYQIKGNTTGVLFRGFITASETNKALAAAMEAKHNLYAYEGIIYGDVDMIKTYVEGHPESEIARMYTATFNEDGTLKSTDPHFATANGFSVYRPAADGKYYCYYYYYNRHNDNGNDTVMGQMEFAAVRNNVYKLFVSSVKEYGHPGDPDDDEKPEDPEDPDESPQTYFRVQVEVLPWVVRVNDINF